MCIMSVFAYRSWMTDSTWAVARAVRAFIKSSVCQGNAYSRANYCYMKFCIISNNNYTVFQNDTN